MTTAERWIHLKRNAISLLDFVHVLLGVLVGHVGWADVQLEVGAKVLKVVIVWELWRRRERATLISNVHQKSFPF